MESLLDALPRPELWERFYEYKAGLCVSGPWLKTLRSIIDRREYLPVCARIARGEPFPLPRRAVISKLHSGSKRTVYIYPEPENTVLKLLTWLLLRRYDGLFAEGLYSFRPGKTAKDAIRALRAVPGMRELYAWKTDIHDYFNSIDPALFLPELEGVLGEDEPLFRFLSGLLLEPEVLDHGRPLREAKGIMAGTPLSAFYANLFLRGLDHDYAARGLPYARYSDDILLFAPSREQAQAEGERLREALKARRLAVNPAKERLFSPEDGWCFLGFQVKGTTVDIAPATLDKLKAKMRRKTRALARWRDRSGRSGTQAAAAFVRVFRRKLLEAPAGRELSWSRWFFPVINTTESLHEIDRYAQDCLRTLISGTRTKARFNVRYDELKQLGYVSLVHAYYAYK